MNTFLIQSHRGAGILAPENTTEAFLLAWELGTTPESDLRTTQDGVIVAFHDKNFARVVKNVPPELCDKGVEDVTFAELSTLDVGAWHEDSFVARRVSAIVEIFELMRPHHDRSLYLDIKNVALPQLAALVLEYEVQHQVILAAPSYAIIQEWHALVPASQTLLWMGGDEAGLRQRVADLRQTQFAAITQLQIHVQAHKQSDGHFALEPSSAFLHELGQELRSHRIIFQALPWHTCEPEVYVMLLELGVQSFATDFPDVTLRVVRDYLAARRDAALPVTQKEWNL